MTTGRLNDGNRPRRTGSGPLNGTGPLRAAPPLPPPPPRLVPAPPAPGRPADPRDADQVARRRQTAELPEVELEGVQAPSREQRQAAAQAGGWDLSDMLGSLTGQAQALNSQAHAAQGQAISQGADRVGDFFGSVLSAVGLEDVGLAVNGAIDTVGDVAEVGTNLFGMLENAVGGLVLGTVETAVDLVEDTAGAVVEGTSRATGIVGDMAESAQASAAAGGSVSDMLSAAGATGAREAQEQLVAPTVAAVGDVVESVEGAVTSTVAFVSTVADVSADILDGGSDAAARSSAAGGSIGDIASAFFEGAGDRAYDRLVVPAMDAVAGPVVMDGLTPRFATDVGDLAPLTQRIDRGETISLFGEVGVTVPTPVPALGVTLDAGARVSLARVETANGRTELQLQIQGHGAAGLELNAGTSLTRGSRGDTIAGVNAGASVNASGAWRGEVSATFAFDPTNPQDMATLAGMMRGFGGAAAGQAIAPGPAGAILGGLIAGGEPTADAIARSRSHLSRIEGALGVQVNATLNLNASAGLSRREAGEGEPAVRELNPVPAAAVEQTNTALMDLTASISGQVMIGGAYDVRTRETTTYMELEGTAELSAQLLGRASGGASAGKIRLAVVTGPNGESRVQVMQELTREQFQGYRTSIENAAGRAIRPGMAALVTDADTVRVTADLNPDVVRRLLAGERSALADAVDLGSGAYTLPANGLVVVHTETRAISLAGQAGSLGLRARAGYENTQETLLLDRSFWRR